MKTVNSFNVYKTKITLHNHKDHIGRCINNQKKFYEFGMLDYIKNNIPNKGTYIDVGANIGNHSVFFGKFCADIVLAFEPVKSNYELLKKNIGENNLDNVYAFENAISSDGRTFGSVEIEKNMGACYLTEGIDIQSINPNTLNFDEMTLLKIDCENMSMEVLKSFIPLIKKHKPHIFIEAEPKELKEILSLIPYQKVRQFNATPTFHLKPI